MSSKPYHKMSVEDQVPSDALIEECAVSEEEFERMQKERAADSPPNQKSPNRKGGAPSSKTRTTRETKYAQTPEPWITSRDYDWMIKAQWRLWSMILLRTKHGQKSEIISNDDAAQVGIDRQYKMKLLHRFAAKSMIHLSIDGNRVPTVALHPNILRFFR